MKRISTGDVIALAVDGVRTAPVGIVTDVDDDSIALRLYQWISGTFGGGPMLVRRRDVRATMWAEPIEDDDQSYDGVTFDMAPLARFQDNWTRQP